MLDVIVIFPREIFSRPHLSHLTQNTHHSNSAHLFAFYAGGDKGGKCEGACQAGEDGLEPGHDLSKIGSYLPVLFGTSPGSRMEPEGLCEGASQIRAPTWQMWAWQREMDSL